MPTTTTAHAMPIPLDSDPVQDGGKSVRDLGNSVDAKLPVSGTGTVTAAAHVAGGLVSYTIAFGQTFAVAPVAVLCYVNGFVANSSPAVVKGTTSVTTTNFAAIVVNTATAAMTFTALPVRWVAIFA